MFDGVELDVNDLLGAIIVVADDILPEAPLPKVVFTARSVGQRHARAGKRPRLVWLTSRPG
jgi:hypothetical protein